MAAGRGVLQKRALWQILNVKVPLFFTSSPHLFAPMMPHPHDQFASDHAPKRVPPEECFSGDRETIFYQASRVEVLNLGPAHSGKTQHFLVFGRWCHITAPEGFFQNEDGLRWGCEIAAYRCDEDGTVGNWERRYVVSDLTFEAATTRLRFLLANDMAELSHTDLPESNG